MSSLQKVGKGQNAVLFVTENIAGAVEALSLLNYLIKNLPSKTSSLVFLSCHGHFLFYLICLLTSNLTQSLDFSFSLWLCLA